MLQKSLHIHLYVIQVCFKQMKTTQAKFIIIMFDVVLLNNPIIKIGIINILNCFLNF